MNDSQRCSLGSTHSALNCFVFWSILFVDCDGGDVVIVEHLCGCFQGFCFGRLNGPGFFSVAGAYNQVFVLTEVHALRFLLRQRYGDKYQLRNTPNKIIFKNPMFTGIVGPKKILSQTKNIKYLVKSNQLP